MTEVGLPSITGGRVAFSRTVQPAQCESARAEAEFSFVLEEGEDPVAVAREWGGRVREVVLEMVGHPASGAERSPPRAEASPPSGRRAFRRRGSDYDDSDDIPF